MWRSIKQMWDSARVFDNFSCGNISSSAFGKILVKYLDLNLEKKCQKMLFNSP